MKMSMKSCLVLVAMMAVVAVGPSMASASVITLADLLQGGTITVGDKEFYGFHDFISHGLGGADPASAASIIVSPLVEGDELGLYFDSAEFFVTSNQGQDTHFEFFVKVLDRTKLISDNTLIMTASQRGTGRASIAEVVDENDDNGDTLATKLVYVNATGSDTTDHKEFTHPASIVHISKDIALVGGSNGQAFMSDFSQTFSQVPEPATLALLGLGGLSLLLKRRRR
jgi:hypothetical protein